MREISLKQRIKNGRDLTETSDQDERDLTETTDQDKRDLTETSDQDERDITEATDWGERDITETTDQDERDITEATDWGERDITETTDQDERDVTEILTKKHRKQIHYGRHIMNTTERDENGTGTTEARKKVSGSERPVNRTEVLQDRPLTPPYRPKNKSTRGKKKKRKKEKRYRN